MSELQIVTCKSCGKVLCEANGEVKKICPKCKTMNHVITNNSGVFHIGIDLSNEPDKTAFQRIEL